MKTDRQVSMTAFEACWDVLQRDVASSPAAHEFPLTTMSRALGERIWSLPPGENLGATPALDVGTGTGAHALLMALRGFSNVIAIDCSSEAIRHAQQRAERLWPLLIEALEPDDRALLTVNGNRSHSIVFHAISVDDVPSLAVPQFALVTFNPPAYYDFGHSDRDLPTFSGVYVDDQWEGAYVQEGTLLHRFFAAAVLPHLRPGGQSINTWAGLERRLVEDPDLPGNVAHPAELLRRWFSVDIDNVLETPSSFFNQSARITSDYGLGSTFWKNLSLGVERGLYSSLLTNRANGRLSSFQFGVLHLVRHDQNHFQVVRHTEASGKLC